MARFLFPIGEADARFLANSSRLNDRWSWRSIHNKEALRPHSFIATNILFIHVNSQMAGLRNWKSILRIAVKLNALLGVEKKHSVYLSIWHEFIDYLSVAICNV